MSDTPRTQAAWETWIANGCAQRLKQESEKLERELAAVTKERDIEIERAWHYRDKWQDALARIKRLEESGNRLDAVVEHIGVIDTEDIEAMNELDEWADFARRSWRKAKEAR
jgi:hypothetical protein